MVYKDIPRCRIKRQLNRFKLLSSDKLVCNFVPHSEGHSHAPAPAHFFYPHP